MTGHQCLGLTVDLVVLTVRDGAFSALLMEREAEPFLGRFALPGGHVGPGEDLLDAARRVAERAGIVFDAIHLEQLATYGRADRDPRGRFVTVGYLAIAPDLAASGTAQWLPAGASDLAFDHDQILADGVERARSKLEYTPLATAFVPEPFRISDLRQVYEAVWGEALDSRNFHRKVTSVPGLIEETGDTLAGERGRPARLFRRGAAELLLPPLLRASLRG